MAISRTLKKRETKFLDGDGLYLITEGKVLMREFFLNGRTVSNECPIGKGEIVGNLFSIFELESEESKDIAIEIEALEETKLVKIDYSETIDKIKNDSDSLFGNLLKQILKKSMINSLYHIYSKKGYMISVLKFYADESGYIDAKYLNPEIVNMSKTGFFRILSEIKNDGLIEQRKNGYWINFEKVNRYLSEEE